MIHLSMISVGRRQTPVGTAALLSMLCTTPSALRRWTRHRGSVGRPSTRPRRPRSRRSPCARAARAAAHPAEGGQTPPPPPYGSPSSCPPARTSTAPTWWPHPCNESHPPPVLCVGQRARSTQRSQGSALRAVFHDATGPTLSCAAEGPTDLGLRTSPTTTASATSSGLAQTMRM